MKRAQFELVVALMVAIVSVTGAVAAYASPAVDEAINPHWTGSHCAECHKENNVPQLRFGADIVKVCNRCHRDAAAGTEIHPIGVALTPSMEKNMPLQWPLKNGTINCLTCHDVQVQMYKNPVRKKIDSDFLRGAPHDSMTDFCFECHQRERFEKLNPHQQLNADGTVKENSCLYCHHTRPDQQRTESFDDLSFVSDRVDICLGCHYEKGRNHPGSADHLVTVPPEMLSALTPGNVDSPYLPLVNGQIFCGTCHNPHDRNIIVRERARAGAGEKYFLRSGGGYDLCVICHDDKRKVKTRQLVNPARNLLRDSPQLIQPHEPWEKGKCKQCHSVTEKNRFKPLPLNMCFSTDCHNPGMLENVSIHEPSVGENCYFCHESHSSNYKKLLRVNEERLCRVCHPFIVDTKEKGKKDWSAEQQREVHQEMMNYMNSLKLDARNTCMFCHTAEHKNTIGSIDPGVCADCHITVQTLLRKRVDLSGNFHWSLSAQPCSRCHDPHAAPYDRLLKQPSETYDQQKEYDE
ncbi:MAG: hypothetical protein GY868_13435 [Deltaproteobacteria bacterium]|nr:hypothetical protein [Deltaproteobacteria bacterium]